MIFDRRAVLTGLGTIALAQLARAAAPEMPRTRLFLLGTAGGPRPRRGRSASAQAIVFGDAVYVVDCGNGVARQLALAGISLRLLRGVFITHHHSDHNADFGALLQLAWSAGLTTTVGCWGPPPLKAMVSDYLRYQSHDIAVRTADEAKVPFAQLISAQEISADGLVVDDNLVRVSCTRVPHPPIKVALAYRFDTPDRSVVISGDTTKSSALVELARDADILVHEVMLADRVKEMVRPLPNAETLATSVINHHTSAEDVGRVAAAARVKLLVLSHFVPAEDPSVPDEEWIAPVRKHFDGPIIVGRDLMEI